MPLTEDTVAFIGCGVMGEAMVKGLLRDRLIGPGQIVVSHPRPERCRDLAAAYGVEAVADNAKAAQRASVVVICVKPQFLGEVLADLAGAVDPAALVMSIVAGARASSFVHALGAPAVVRVMPNTPGQIGRGISVWSATDEVPAAGRDKARAILSALGVEEYVTHESELDMATALSGTGPAYTFLFMEALVDAGVHLGFSRRVAYRLVVETMRGAVEYADSSPLHLAKLRNQVTSPGGTSAEALYHLEKGRLRTVLSDGVWAAYRRCVELGTRVVGGEANRRGGPSGGDD
jgi:pyrroline-5-carboxylate reductase